jgi:hypothetical protein
MLSSECHKGLYLENESKRLLIQEEDPYREKVLLSDMTFHLQPLLQGGGLESFKTYGPTKF